MARLSDEFDPEDYDHIEALEEQATQSLVDQLHELCSRENFRSESEKESAKAASMKELDRRGELTTLETDAEGNPISELLNDNLFDEEPEGLQLLNSEFQRLMGT